MKNWFVCKVTYPKIMDDGRVKKFTNDYLVEGVTFTDAENLLTEEMAKSIGGDFNVAAVKKEKVSEIFEDKEIGGSWFKTKVVMVILDEESGREKRTSVNMYLQTLEIKNVINELTERLRGSMSDYTITSIVETKILDLFRNETSDDNYDEDNE